MADTTIDGLPAAAALTGAEELPVWQSAATKKTTIAAIAALSGPTKATIYTKQTVGFQITADMVGTIVPYDSASAGNAALPAALGVGFQIGLLQRGAGQLTVVPGSGVTVMNPYGYTKTVSQSAVIWLTCTDSAAGADFYKLGGEGA